jgi:Beta-ketoacyl synthase, N-terminal domain
LQTDLYITASCLISRNNIFKNGYAVFEHPGSAGSFLDETYTHFEISYPKFHKMDALCKLGFLAAEFLLKDTGHEKKYDGSETGLVICNSHGSLDVDLKYAKTIHSGASPSLFVYTLPNIVIGEICIRHHFKGENAFFVFKQFDGNFIAQYVNGLFENKLIKNCICGWVDILKEDYRALLFLVETDNPGKAIPFTGEQMNQLNQMDHG